MKILGKCFGVDITRRSDNDPHLMIKIIGEDDGFWHDEMDFDSAWLGELIDILNEAKIHCQLPPAKAGA